MNRESSSEQGRSSGGSASDQLRVERDRSTEPVDVVLAAPDDSIRAELRRRLEEHGGFVIAAEKSNATQALGAALFHSPRVCLFSVDLPGELEARIRSIRAERPDTRIGIVAGSADEPGLLRAVLAGADGVLLTSDPAETFAAEVHALARGERVLPPEGAGDGVPTGLEGGDTPEPDADIALGFRPESESEGEAALAAGQPTNSRFKATVLYLPRFFYHLRRRLRAGMPLSIAWSSARERMWDYQ